MPVIWETIVSRKRSCFNKKASNLKRSWIHVQRPISLQPWQIFFFLFVAVPSAYRIPRLGVESELHLRSTPQPQQHRIWATSLTYSAACCNVGSLTYWARPGMEPASSQRQQSLTHWTTIPAMIAFKGKSEGEESQWITEAGGWILHHSPLQEQWLALSSDVILPE